MSTKVEDIVATIVLVGLATLLWYFLKKQFDKEPVKDKVPQNGDFRLAILEKMNTITETIGEVKLSAHISLTKIESVEKSMAELKDHFEDCNTRLTDLEKDHIRHHK